MRGIVKWFNGEKGYGFITQDAGGPDVFVHYSAVQMRGRKTLQEGEAVEFETRQTDKGLAAVDVRRVDAPVSPAPRG